MVIRYTPGVTMAEGGSAMTYPDESHEISTVKEFESIRVPVFVVARKKRVALPSMFWF